MALRPASSRHLIPVRLTWEGSEPVAWCYDFRDLAFTDPFFDHTCQRLCRQEPGIELVDISLAELLDETANDLRLEPSGFLFHMSRCGSTAVSWTLSTSDRTLVLAEPGPVNDLLNAPPEIDGPVLERHLRDLLSLLGRPRRTGEERYVVKFSSILSTHLPLIRAAFPDTPWGFVFRDPVEVMVSVLERPAGFLRRKANRPERAAGWLQIAPETIPAMTDEEYVARILARFIECALQESERGRPGRHRMVDYASLPGAIWNEVAPLFGIGLDPGTETRMRERSSINSKDRSGVACFQADSDWKAQRAGRRIREEAERWADAPYQRLRQRARQLFAGEA